MIIFYKLLKPINLIGLVLLTIMDLYLFLSVFNIESILSIIAFSILAYFFAFLSVKITAYEDICLTLKEKVSEEELLGQLKKAGADLYVDKLEISKKEWGYVYFASVYFHSMKTLPPGWKEYDGKKPTPEDIVDLAQAEAQL